MNKTKGCLIANFATVPYEDLMNNQKIPDSGVLTQKVKEQIADQLKQAGQ
ncbi:hypothetical protein SJ378_22460 [Escherichia coli]|nr:hypothetical protein [Escherichia coli]MDX7414832.1 hypothetical protein [Escherichia coli]